MDTRKQINAENQMDTRIYVMTHKQFEQPEDPLYIPLQVGRALHEDLGYQGDHTGDQISDQNPYFSELTGIYWIWKNVTEADIVGICHYRRYLVTQKIEKSSGSKMLVKEEKLYRKEQIEEILEKYDMITSNLLTLSSNYYDGFSVDHHIRDLLTTQQVIQEKYPDYAEMFQKLVQERHTYFGNICVAHKKTFDAYCAWLFDILFEVRKRTDLTGYDGYRRRLFGFLSEFLLLVYTRVNRMKVYESRVAIIGEKAETREVKEELAYFFQRGDYSGAKEYFLEKRSEKPDLTMEASDTTGELRLCMQIISTCEFEQDKTGTTILDRERDYQSLISLFRRMNLAAEHFRDGEETEEDGTFLKNAGLTESAVYIAAMVVCSGDQAEKAFQSMQKCIL